MKAMGCTDQSEVDNNEVMQLSQPSTSNINNSHLSSVGSSVWWWKIASSKRTCVRENDVLVKARKQIYILIAAVCALIAPTEDDVEVKSEVIPELLDTYSDESKCFESDYKVNDENLDFDESFL